MRKILHLCADIGSDSRPYQLDSRYEVVLVGKDIGVENFSGKDVWGVIANPVCKEFSTVRGFDVKVDTSCGIRIVNECLRIIRECQPKWWVLENPANGRLKEFIGPPKHVYQPWQYGSPWTKKTALWGEFVMPAPLYETWSDVEKNDSLYVRPNRVKPSLAYLHKSHTKFIPEFDWARDKITSDSDLRSMCSQGFANEFKKSNE